MRIVKVIPDFGIGGIQKGGCVVAAGLGAAGHEVVVIGAGDGPRRLDKPPPGVTHRLVERADDGSFCREILSVEPDVVHIRAADYDEALIARLTAKRTGQANAPLLVVTPEFGRPPSDRRTLDRCRTCLVGAYMLYRQRLWMGMTSDEALRHGLGFVWLNTCEPSDPPQSTLDRPDVAAARRASLGVPQDAFVFGRIGRDTPGKWHPAYPLIIDRVLSKYPNAVWLSIGFPEERGRSDLHAQFGKRFVNHPETADYLKLAQTFAAMDVQVFFSRWGECFSTTICEAAGVGLPTIAGVNPLRDNGQSEQVIDGVNGYLVATPEQALERLGRLIADRDALRQMKQTTVRHTSARWITARTTENLIAFYEAWRSSDPLATPYLQQMRAEEARFAADYQRRMLDLLAEGPMQRVAWRMKLAAVSNWNTFRLGRLVKRVLPRPATADSRFRASAAGERQHGKAK